MFGRKPKTARTTNSEAGPVDGGEGRGVPLGGRDDRPPTGYSSTPEDDIETNQDPDADAFWDEGDPADRRRDPLRKP
jgi:hypothetical protein